MSLISFMLSKVSTLQSRNWTQSSAAKLLGILALVISVFSVLLAPQAAHAQNTITNSASISPPTGIANTNTAPGCSGGTCTVADLDTVNPALPVVSKSFTPSTIIAGGTSLLVISISNTHSLTVANLTSALVDTYPAGLTNGPIPAPTSSCAAGPAPVAAVGGGSITIGIGTQINPASTCTVSVVVTSSASPQVTNTIAAGALVTNNGSNAAPATATLSVLAPADLAITKTTSNSQPTGGGTFTYTIVVENKGPSALVNATWTDTLPANLGTITNVVTTSGISAVVSGTTISGTTTLTNGQFATVTFQVSIDVTASGSRVNTATVAVPAGYTDPVPGNNTSTASITIKQPALLSVTKTNGTTTLAAGSTTNYTITFNNAGPAAANGSVIRDIASAGLVCTSITCTTVSGGAVCPTSLPLGTPVLTGSTNFLTTTGELLNTFPANSSVVLVVSCGVTATGQ